MKFYQEREARLTHPEQNTDFLPGEKNHHNAYPQNDITAGKLVAVPGNPNFPDTDQFLLLSLYF